MNYDKWIKHFNRNAEERPEPNWSAPRCIPKRMLAPLKSSIEQFQLGDGGGPASLIAFNREQFRGGSLQMRQIVDAWFAEEKEHSRLLGCAVERLEGQRITGHWSFSAFCLCRRIFGVRFELQVLLLTELVSTAYYRVLKRYVPDEPLRQMCALILRDEAGHVAFHRDRLEASGIGPNGFAGSIWEMQFWFCGHAAATVLWSSHGKCLRALGGTRAEYFCEVRYELARFARSLTIEAEASQLLPHAVFEIKES